MIDSEDPVTSQPREVVHLVLRSGQSFRKRVYRMLFLKESQMMSTSMICRCMVETCRKRKVCTGARSWHTYLTEPLFRYGGGQQCIRCEGPQHQARSPRHCRSFLHYGPSFSVNSLLLRLERNIPKKMEYLDGWRKRRQTVGSKS